MERSFASVDVAQLMASFRQGDPLAAGQLVELLYPELRRIAAAQMMGEKKGHSWQPTVLVNELYLELIKIKALQPSGPDHQAERAAFLGLAAHIMRRLLIHHARPLSRRVSRVSPSGDFPDLDQAGAETLAELDNLLSRLARVNPRLRTVVEMRVFYGYTLEEIAKKMDCALVTVKRYWSFAKQWLADSLAEKVRS
jgi:RNA polymerase sigma factor (TIGR02999 family)